MKWFKGLLYILSFITVVFGGLSPVILVPGDGGSQIDARWNKTVRPHYMCSLFQDKWYNIWLNLQELAPFSIDCFTENIKLVYDVKARASKNPAGVETRVPGFGSSDAVEYLDPSHFYGTSYFLPIAKALLGLGYQRGDTLFGAPFDFRKAPNELGDYFVNLKKLVEDAYVKRNEKVTLLSHSMGGPISQYFLIKQSQAWKDKYIKAIISLSAPWAGAVKSFKVFAAGYDLGHYLLPTATLRSIQISYPSLAFLLPSANEWGMNEVLAEAPYSNKTYSISNLKEYFDDMHYPVGYLMYEDTHKLLLNAPPPGVEVHCLYGSGVPTTEKIIFHAASDFPSNPAPVTGDGDGTVNLRSATYCKKWAPKQKAQIFSKAFRGVDHMAMLTNTDVVAHVVKILRDFKDVNKKKTRKRILKEKFKMKRILDRLEVMNMRSSKLRERAMRKLAVQWLNTTERNSIF